MSLIQTKVPGLPSVPSDAPAGIKRWLDAAAQILGVREGHRGDKLDAAVTFRDLVASGIVSMEGKTTGAVGPRSDFPPLAPPGGSDPGDLTPPPALTGMNVVPGMNLFFIDWPAQTYTQG